ncbi:hypothetical protein SLEP1_g6608 [Rubroshorea leprosula]|uniref:Uncharacterized protein n=1 Tax=Rubroshorea leprosula TaxID=152421 RepID=A0AAV5I4Y7_9ROSI|nr:hypothetical protein SLEP1_g6608 [Rubroshorea leprosula]
MGGNHLSSLIPLHPHATRLELNTSYFQRKEMTTELLRWRLLGFERGMRRPRQTAASNSGKGTSNGFQGSTTSYWGRVKIANRPWKKFSRLGKEIITGTVMRKTSSMNRLVQPGQSYAQDVMGKGNWVEKNQAQGKILEEKKTVVFQEKGDTAKMQQNDETEEIGSCEKENGQERIVGRIEEQSKEIIIDFSPTKQEI